VSRKGLPEPIVPHTREVLFSSLGISIVDFRCRADVEPEGPEEPNPTHSVVLVRRGVFRRRQRRDSVVADANHVLFFNAGQPYHFSHPVPGGDDCTILALDAPVALELVARHSAGDDQRPETPFRLGHALSSPRAARLHFELLSLLRPSPGPRLALEDLLVELADDALGTAYRLHGEGSRRDRPSAAAEPRRRDLVEAVKVMLNAQLESPPALGVLARAVGCSPFHLSRSFHHVTGLSLRRYVGRLRVRAAAGRLAAGCRSITDLALDLGYADHSHLTNSFRREWGVPPSQFRRLVAVR